MRKTVAAGLGGTLLAILACFLYHYTWMKCERRPSAEADLLLASPDELKRHALDTFAEYTASGPPKWESWPDKCEVHLLDNCAQKNGGKNESTLFHLIHGLQIPPELSPDIRRAMQSRTFAIQHQAVYYNDVAARTILQHRLYSKAVLDSRLDGLNNNKVATADLTVPDFDPGSVVVKTFWEWILPVAIFPPSPTGYTPVSLFNSTTVHPGSNGRLPDLYSWPWNYIDTTQRDKCEQKSYKDGHIYALGCFLFHEVSSNEYRLLRNDARLTLPGEDDLCGKKKCYFVLTAVHIITHETPNWVWMTYWWTNEGRSNSVSNKWNFFDAKASISNMGPIGSPYVEQISPGVNSNCIGCHRFAAYNPFVLSSVGLKHAGDDIPKPYASDLQYPPCYFGAMLRTHFLWTVATHKDGTISQNTDPC